MKNALGKIIMIIAAAILVGTLIQTKYAAADEIGRDGQFIAYNDGTVLDTKTNLMWAAKDNGEDIEWQDATNYCEHYQGGGYTGWRMPTQSELAGLYDKNKSYKSACGDDVHITELIRLSCSWIWASAIRVPSFFGDRAADFNFNYGNKGWHHPTHAYPYRALPVRSTKTAKPAPLNKTDADVDNNSESSEYSQKLRELKKLKDEGLLTDSEYEQKRKAIVDSM